MRCRCHECHVAISTALLASLGKGRKKPDAMRMTVTGAVGVRHQYAGKLQEDELREIGIAIAEVLSRLDLNDAEIQQRIESPSRRNG
jgi:hypothetical protein